MSDLFREVSYLALALTNLVSMSLRFLFRRKEAGNRERAKTYFARP